MRLFIASRVSEGVLAGIERFLEPLRPSFGDSVKWVPARDMHLTWVFLGEITEAGAIPAFDMTSEAAATKLMWVLAQTKEMEKIKEMMRTNYCGEITAI